MVIADCLQTVGSGLGMNAGRADGIYSQNHLVTRIVHCVGLLMNTACMYDAHLQQSESAAAPTSLLTLRGSVVSTLLQRMLCSWPHATYTRGDPSKQPHSRAGTIHPLLLQGIRHQTAAQLLKLDGYPAGRMDGCIDAATGEYLAVRVNSPNAVREEAYLSTCFEILCSHACVEAYEWHQYQADVASSNSCEKVPPISRGDASQSKAGDVIIDRVLSKLLSGIHSDHFKIALKCLACLQDRGMCILARYFLEQPETESMRRSVGTGAGDQPPPSASPCDRSRRGCAVCRRHVARREERLADLVSALRAARGAHWNSMVREAAGELLDQLMDIL